MRLTRASSYALHALVYMAGEKHNRPIPSHLVARDRGIPERFLLKVLKPLVSARVLLSSSCLSSPPISRGFSCRICFQLTG